jgi:hypothetical protein
MANEDSVIFNLVDRLSQLLEKFPVESRNEAKLTQDEIQQHNIREDLENTLKGLAKTKLEMILDKFCQKLEKVIRMDCFCFLYLFSYTLLNFNCLKKNFK